MTRDDIIRIAQEVGFEAIRRSDKRFERFAALVEAAEREACAAIADRYHVPDAIAAAIRARGQV